MKFEKRNFMGIELDVLVGHPDHDLLFIVAQVARASGLKNVYNLTCSYKRLKLNADRKWFALGDIYSALPLLQGQVADAHGRTLPANTTLFTEGDVYAMMLRSNSDATEPFRKWVTEEVLPTIRKTGTYKAEESTNPIAVGVMDELKALRGLVESQGVQLGELKLLLQGMGQGVSVTSVKSPYEGVQKGTVWYHTSKQGIREAGEVLKLNAATSDKLFPRAIIRIEQDLVKQWKAADGRALDAEFSAGSGRNWTLWPMDFLRGQLTRSRYIETMTTIINEAFNK